MSNVMQVALIVFCLQPMVCMATEFEKSQHDAAGRDLLGEKELAAPGDPSFESVSRHFPAMKFPREAIGVKDGPSEFIVRPDGSIQFNGMQNRHGYLPESKIEHLFFEIGDPAIRLGSGECPCSKHLLEGYLPIVIAEYEHNGLKYEQTAFGWSPGMSPETPLTAYLRLRVSNPGGENRAESIRCRIQLGKSVKTVATWKLEVGAETERSVYIKAPSIGTATGATKDSSTEFEKCLDEAVAFWKGILSKGMEINVPEQRVGDAYRAWLAYNFLNVDKRGNIYEPHDGNGFYEEIYGYSAALYCHALDLLGYHEEAQTYLDSLGTFVSPEGLFTKNYGLPDTGALLFAMSQHYQLTADKPWLRKSAPTMIKMCNWIIRKRKQVMAEQQKDSAVYGLIKFRPYADHEKPTYSYLTDCYLALGMQSASESLRAVGMANESARIGTESNAYRRDILRSMHRAVIERGGMKILPLFPETKELLKSETKKWLKKVDYTAADYYSLVAGMLLETEFLLPSDEPAGWIKQLMEQRRGLVLGMCSFSDGVDHAYTYGYWLDCLHRDEVKRVLLGFYGSLAYGMSRGTYAAVGLARRAGIRAH